MLHFDSGTWLQSEENAYPNGGQTRKGKARFPDGAVRTVYAGIADTYFTIPAHARIGGKYVAGYLDIEGPTWDPIAAADKGGPVHAGGIPRILPRRP